MFHQELGYGLGFIINQGLRDEVFYSTSGFPGEEKKRGRGREERREERGGEEGEGGEKGEGGRGERGGREGREGREVIT